MLTCLRSCIRFSEFGILNALGNCITLFSCFTRYVAIFQLSIGLMGFFSSCNFIVPCMCGASGFIFIYFHLSMFLIMLLHVLMAHRVVRSINDGVKIKHLSAAFSEISQACDKVWHIVLLYQLRHSLRSNYLLILKSYLHSRQFLVKVESEYTALLPINAGVHGSSVLGTVLCLTYTANLPTSQESITALFGEDTAVLLDCDSAIAPQKLQTKLLAFQYRFKIGEYNLKDRF
jgi:hypothetical protein